ncbi:MAG: sugar phosphate isomerase/epimerase family protein [Acidobacteriaceae bacterium]
MAIARALNIPSLDVGYFYRSALDRSRVLEEPEKYADEVVRSIGASPSNFFHLFGQTIQDRNLADSSSAQENFVDFAKALRFCVACGIPSIMVLPGVVNPGQSRGEALDASSATLAHLQSMAAKANVLLTIEAHVHSYLESPEQTLKLLEMVPGLRLTLDYSHFLCLGYRQEEIDELAPYAAHVHLRQARAGVLQARLEMGTLNFNAILGVLRDADYSGFLALECVHQEYMNTLFEDVLSETIKLRDLVNAWSSSSK